MLRMGNDAHDRSQSMPAEDNVQSPVKGALIRQLRDQRNENREAVAVRASVSSSTLQRAEASDPSLSFRTLVKIARALDVDVNEIYEGVEEFTPAASSGPPVWFTQWAEQLSTRLEAYERGQKELIRVLDRIEKGLSK